ncbi:hypothetical protein NGA_0211900, partial [Nannochloropsis gaditana CCMP526]|uniref:uncharacterized protein n=1 Tax=Nannochloropsis gaditana (strain CCMP526) TaxID=1093141 RepID=UPI00029F6BE8
MGTVHGHNQRVMESVGRVQDFKTGDGSVEEHIVFNAAVEILRLARCYQVGITFQDPSLAEAAARALDREGGKEGREEPREGTTVPRDHPSSSGLA